MALMERLSVVASSPARHVIGFACMTASYIGKRALYPLPILMVIRKMRVDIGR